MERGFGAWRCLLLGVLALVFGVSACSGSDSESGSVDPGVTSGVTATSESTTATTSETTTTTAEVETTTTSEVVNLAALEAELAEAGLNHFVVWRECALDLPNCDPETKMSTVATGKWLVDIVARADSLKADGLEIYLPEDAIHDSVTVVSVGEVDESATEATILLCRVDEAVIFDPGGAPDGSDVIVNDNVSATLIETVMILDVSGEWLVKEIYSLDVQPGGTECSEPVE